MILARVLLGLSRATLRAAIALIGGRVRQLEMSDLPQLAQPLGDIERRAWQVKRAILNRLEKLKGDESGHVNCA